MPDTFTVNQRGQVVEIVRDRSGAFETIYGMNHMSVAVMYRGDIHDPQSPPRINPVARAARRRREAYFVSLRNCIYCGVDEDGHRWSDIFQELYDEDACDDFTAPAPLVVSK